MSDYLFFRENFEIEKGRNLQIAIKEVLHTSYSKFQKIEVFETVSLGKMLVLDGVIMLTQFDNFAYHEMIVHVPMNVHPNPEKVLIVGGGDGGALKEVLKYESVKEVVLCEIDEEVITVSKKYFPEFADSFNDKRVTVVVEDAAKYMKNCKNVFDVMCVDSSDPVGPAEILFQKEFYMDMLNALTEKGIAVTQSESMYFHKEFISKLYKQNKEIFKAVSYYYTLVPTYPSGTIGFSFCSKQYDPMENVNSSRINKLKGLQYYSADIHRACFSLPKFMAESLNS